MYHNEFDAESLHRIDNVCCAGGAAGEYGSDGGTVDVCWHFGCRVFLHAANTVFVRAVSAMAGRLWMESGIPQSNVLLWDGSHALFVVGEEHSTKKTCLDGIFSSALVRLVGCCW